MKQNFYSIKNFNSTQNLILYNLAWKGKKMDLTDSENSETSWSTRKVLASCRQKINRFKRTIGVKHPKKHQKISSKKRKLAEKPESEDEATDPNDQCFEGIDFHQKCCEKVEISLTKDIGLSILIGESHLDAKQCRRLIREFGDSISSLKLSYSDSCNKKSKKIFQKLIDEVSKHSLESLAKIEFVRFPSNWLNKFSKPLPSVQSVTLKECDLSDKTRLLYQIFPNINHLSVWCSLYSEHNEIITHFPFLKKLELLNGHGQDGKATEFESFVNFDFKLTSWLYGSFNDDSNIDWKFLQFIEETSQRQRLELCSSI